MANTQEILQNINSGIYQMSERRGKSAVWTLYTYIKKEDGTILDGFVYCRKCKNLLKYNGKQTSNLARHKCFIRPSGVIVMQKVNQEDKEDAIDACTQWVAEDCRPFSAIQESGFTKLAQFFVNIGAKYGKNIDIHDLIPDAKTVSRNIHKMASEKKCRVDSKKRNYGEAFDDTSSASDGNDCIYGEYIDMGYEIKPEPDQVNGDIDDDMDDNADDDDDNRSPLDDDHCDGDDITTSNLNLKELLMQSNKGQNALSYYDLHNRLNVKHREVVFNTLTNIINSSSECQKYNENLKRISRELRQLFPMENYSTLELHKYSMRFEMGETPQQEDPKLYNLLNLWRLTHLYDHFRAENITFDVVKIMETKHIDRLFKNLTIGDNVLFDHHFKKWLVNGSQEPSIDLNLKPQRKGLSTSQN